MAVAVLADPRRHGGRSYRPTGPALLSTTEMAAAIGRAIGKRVLPVGIPLWMFTKTARMQGVNPYAVSGFRFYLQDHWRGAFSADGGVTDVVRELTGSPAEDFETTARRYAAKPFAQRTRALRRARPHRPHQGSAGTNCFRKPAADHGSSGHARPVPHERHPRDRRSGLCG